MDDELLARAIAAIDAVNAHDPNVVTARGVTRPKELAHAELVTDWVRVLEPAASAELLLAARAHHVQRWLIPRTAQPAGRAGYLRWRRSLHELHATKVDEILAGVGCDAATIARVQTIVAKRGLGHDAEVQTLEDAICLVFVETQLHDLHARLGHDKMVDVARKTLAKMSPRAVALAASLELGADDRSLLADATA